MNLALPATLSLRPALGWLMQRSALRARPRATRASLAPWQTLPKDAVWVLPHPRGQHIECLGGTLWITQDHQQRDIVLAPGQSYTAEGPHQLLVQALAAARFLVHPA